jgi:hypothetical protein
MRDSPSALWLLMMGHQTKTHKQPDGKKRVFFTDNFYTQHNLAATLQKFTDGESKMIGTVKFTNVDGANQHHLSKAMELMKDAQRGEWMLVRAYHKHPDYDKLQRDHSNQQRCLEVTQR